jgi:phospholipid/cholesterol/gamma-HCH transport system substrate-binding protein
METRANYIVVGVFAFIALLAGFGFVYWIDQYSKIGEAAFLRIRVPGSAAGLDRGSLVLFNGVRIGQIDNVYLDLNDPTIAIADATVDRSIAPITLSTRADIAAAGLTGGAVVELRGGATGEPSLFDDAERKGEVAVIVANPSAVTNLLQTAQDIFVRVEKVLGELEAFVGDARGPLTATVENAQKFSEALARNADGVDKFLDSVAKLSEELAGVSGKLDSTLTAAEDLLKSVDRDKVATVVANVEEITANLKQSSAEIEKLMEGVKTTVASVNDFAANANQTLAKVDGIVEGVDPETIKTAITDIGEASRNANKVVEDVSKVTSRFGERAEDIDKIISDAGQIAERINQASVRVDGVLAKLDSLLGSGEAEGVMTEANATLKEFRKVAETLNARMGTIADGLARFSGQGLREVEALIGESRRAVSRIEQAITNIERNPQRLLTGGEGTIRQYDGRARR